MPVVTKMGVRRGRALSNAGDISFSETPADTSRPLSPCVRLKTDANGEPVLHFDLPEPGPLILLPASTSTRREAVLRQEVDDPNEPYSDIDEELMAMAVPEPAIVSHLMSRLTKPSGF